MPTDRFSHSYRIAAPATVIYAHLMNPYSYVGLSPLVIAVRDVHPARDAQGREAIAYTAVQHVRWGPFRWDDTVHTIMTGVPERQVLSSATGPDGVRSISTIVLEAHDGTTTVTETIELHSRAPLRHFVLGWARSGQQDRAAELTRRMEC